MILHELTINGEGALSMNADKAGRVNGETYTKNERGCVHQRMVDYHYNEKRKLTGNVVCRECGSVIPDPVKVLG